jgi:hypothetical protein
VSHCSLPVHFLDIWEARAGSTLQCELYRTAGSMASGLLCDLPVDFPASVFPRMTAAVTEPLGVLSRDAQPGQVGGVEGHRMPAVPVIVQLE